MLVEQNSRIETELENLMKRRDDLRVDMGELESAIQSEKQRLIQKILKLKQGGQPAVPPQMKAPKLWHCEDLGEE